MHQACGLRRCAGHVQYGQRHLFGDVGRQLGEQARFKEHRLAIDFNLVTVQMHGANLVDDAAA
jgi:hypothetical protein